MTVDLAITCECCQQDVPIDGEIYCGDCWAGTISALPKAEELIRALGKRLGGEAQRSCDRVADHLYDLNFEERTR